MAVDLWAPSFYWLAHRGGQASSFLRFFKSAKKVFRRDSKLEMIYRKWSLLMTPPLIVGTLVTGTLVYNFFLGGNERFFKRIREQEQEKRLLNKKS